MRPLVGHRFLLCLPGIMAGVSASTAGDLTVEVFSRSQVTATANVKSENAALTKNPSTSG